MHQQRQSRLRAAQGQWHFPLLVLQLLCFSAGTTDAWLFDNLGFGGSSGSSGAASRSELKAASAKFKPPSYMICNRAVDQLLFHAANIAALHLGVYEDEHADTAPLEQETVSDQRQDANKEEDEEDETDFEETENNGVRRRGGGGRHRRNWQSGAIRIPNVFIYAVKSTTAHGLSSRSTSVTKNTLPRANNSVPLTRVLDTESLIRRLHKRLGIRAVLDKTATLTTTVINNASPQEAANNNDEAEQDDEDDKDDVQRRGPQRHHPMYYETIRGMACRGMETVAAVAAVEGGSELMGHILQLLEPGGHTMKWVDFIVKELPEGRYRADGLCVHYPHSREWNRACEAWKLKAAAAAATKHVGLYRGNCDWQTSSTFRATDTISGQDDDEDEQQQQQQQQQSADQADYVREMKEKHVNDALWHSLKHRGLVRDSLIYYAGGGGDGSEGIPPGLLYNINRDERGELMDKQQQAVFGHLSFWNSTRRIRPKQARVFLDEVLPGQNISSSSLAATVGGEDQAQDPNAVAVSPAPAAAAVNGRDNAEFWNLVDFFCCREMRSFVGNSVSTFAALQIHHRQHQLPDANNNKKKQSQGEHKQKEGRFPPFGTYWYNSESIPLGQVWKNSFDIPFVYTYTELGEPITKYHLMASIASLRAHMPQAHVILLYGVGESGQIEDESLQTWLVHEQNVLVHEHEPAWAAKLATAREEAVADLDPNELSPHDKGQQFGKWQRIDVPIFVPSEYGLFVDSDTLFRKPIDLIGSGMILPNSLGLSANSEHDDDSDDDNEEEEAQQDNNNAGSKLVPPKSLSSTAVPDAGVMLLNIPWMRQTYRDFLRHVLKEGEFDYSPVGKAYTTFYKKRATRLPNRYAVKPHWSAARSFGGGGAAITSNNNNNGNGHQEEDQEAAIIHFQGPKPVDLIQTIVRQASCRASYKHVCLEAMDVKALTRNAVCASLALFARHVAVIGLDSGRTLYCEEAFPTTDLTAERRFCQALLQNLLPPRRSYWRRSMNIGGIAGSSGGGNATMAATNALDPCNNFTRVIQRSLDSIPLDLNLPREEIAMRFGFWTPPNMNNDGRSNTKKSANETSLPPGALLMGSLSTTVMGGLLLAYLWYRFRKGVVAARGNNSNNNKKQRQARRRQRRILLVATVVWVLLCFVIIPMLWTTVLQ